MRVGKRVVACSAYRVTSLKFGALSQRNKNEFQYIIGSRTNSMSTVFKIVQNFNRRVAEMLLQLLYGYPYVLIRALGTTSGCQVQDHNH